MAINYTGNKPLQFRDNCVSGRTDVTYTNATIEGVDPYQFGKDNRIHINRWECKMATADQSHTQPEAKCPTGG